MMLSEQLLNEVQQFFMLPAPIKETSPVKEGLINNTFLLVLADGTKYLLQNINTGVFKNPEELMKNISSVTEHLRRKTAENRGDPDRETLRFLPGTDGKYFYRDEKGGCWRMYHYHDNARTYSNVKEPRIMEKIGKAFGSFQSLLADYPIDSLYETIPDFHNTEKRVESLKKAVSDNLSGRADTCEEEIRFALSHEQAAKKLVRMLENGELPLRVTHNDTKSNNVLFDKTTGEAFCVIDLDTVMPGLSLYDFGDAMRSGAAKIIEDSPEYDKAGIDTDLYEAYVTGYLETAAQSLTENEVKLLGFSAMLLTYECGIRFLTDYLDGDTYFKTTYPEHNLVRAKNQFAMVRDIESKAELLDEITNRAYEKAMKN